MNLEAAKATVREIIRLASIRDAHFADAFDRESAERKCNQLVHNSTKALSQLLEAVEGMERLEKEWLAEAKFYKSDRDGSYPAYKACTDAIHRLLHPEDK